MKAMTNKDHKYSANSSIEDVMRDPERYVVMECLLACEELWSKNIYTFMTSSNYDLKNGSSWIEILNCNLSDRNKDILRGLYKSPDVMLSSYYDGHIRLTVPCTGRDAQGKLFEIARIFEMQDVQAGEAYRNINMYDDLYLYDGEILDGDRIYRSQFHCNNHIRYLEYLESHK